MDYEYDYIVKNEIKKDPEFELIGHNSYDQESEKLYSDPLKLSKYQRARLSGHLSEKNHKCTKCGSLFRQASMFKT